MRIKHLELVHRSAGPGHAATEAFCQAEFDDTFKKAKNQDDCQRPIVGAWSALNHPRATDALLARYEKTIGKANAWTYWYRH